MTGVRGLLRDEAERAVRAAAEAVYGLVEGRTLAAAADGLAVSVMVGGRDAAGNDLTNELSYLSLEALRVLQGASTYVVRSSNASGLTLWGEAAGVSALRVGRLQVATRQ